MKSKPAVISFVLGLVLLLIGILPFFGRQFISTITGKFILLLSLGFVLLIGPFINIAGIILGIVGLVETKKKKMKGMWFAIGGLILVLVNIIILFGHVDEFLRFPFS